MISNDFMQKIYYSVTVGKQLLVIDIRNKKFSVLVYRISFRYCSENRGRVSQKKQTAQALPNGR